MLKIFEKPPEALEPITYLFHFNTSEAKAEAQAVKDLLSRILADLRANDPSIPKPASTVGTPAPAQNGQSNSGVGVASSMAMASAVNHSAKWFDDTQLRNDIELQQSLMKKDASLHRTYMDAISTKPDSISGAAFNSQFWSTRLNLLRAHAIDMNQKKGAYNALAVIKPLTVDGEVKLNMSVEQVQMVLTQHPLVKRLYNENVPKVDEATFWSRFFLSRLSKKLKGERVTESDSADMMFDLHDISENTISFQSRAMAQHVPHIIDLEGNEENTGGVKSGNEQAWAEMRPKARMAIVKTLNDMSEKMMLHVAPSDAVDDGYTYSQVALRDLKGPEKEHRIMLNVKAQSQFFSHRDTTTPSTNALTFSQQNPASVLSCLQNDLATLPTDGAGGLDLHAGIGFNSDSDSDSDDKKAPHVGSRSSIRFAENEINKAIIAHRAQKHATTSETLGLTPALYKKASLTHATSLEFLHQFWTAFLSGDADRATELSYLSSALQNSLARISAVADDAERDREERIKAAKAEIREHWERTGKKIRWKADSVSGGRGAVECLMGGVREAVQRGLADYQRALAVEGLTASTE